MEIYKITNNIDKKCYIGQTIWSFKDRYNNGNWAKFTTNKYLKNAIKKHGKDNFSVKIIHSNIKNRNELNDLEVFYIKKYNSIAPNGYNLQEGGYRCKGKRNYSAEKEYELVNVNGDILKVKNLRFFCKTNNLNYSAMLNMVSKRNLSSQGYALSSTNKNLILDINQEFEIQNIKTQEVFKIKRKDVKDFCDKKGLKTRDFYSIINKKRYSHKGYKLKELILPENYYPDLKYKNAKFINPNGELVVINNIYDFCKKNGYRREGFYNLIKGKSLIYKGWTLPIKKEELKEKQELRLGKNFKLKNLITKEIVETRNICKFCRDRKLNLNNVNSVIFGNNSIYDGWCLDTCDKEWIPPKKIIYIKIENENGEIREAKNPKEIEKKYKDISSVSIGYIINNKCKSVKGWTVKKVQYYKSYYPEINN